jgi:hypothetical protein
MLERGFTRESLDGEGHGRALYQPGLATSTPGRKAMVQMLGEFSEFE